MRLALGKQPIDKLHAAFPCRWPFDFWRPGEPNQKEYGTEKECRRSQEAEKLGHFAMPFRGFTTALKARPAPFSVSSAQRP